MMQLLIAAGIYLLAAARIPALLKFGRDTVFLAAMLSGTAALLTNPTVYVFTDGVLGGRNWVKLGLHTLLVLGLWYLRKATLHAIAPESADRKSSFRSLPLAIVLVLQTVFFIATDVGPTTTNFGDDYNTRPAGALFSAMVMVFMGLAFAEIALVCRRFVPRMHGAFRVGFTMVGIGSATGTLTAVFMVADVLSNAIPSMAAMNIHKMPLYQVLQLIPVGLIGPGLTIPALAGRAERKRTERWERETLTRVRPIRERVLKTAGLDRILEHDVNATVEDRLHRLIVEIWDAELATAGASTLTAEERAYVLSVEHKLALDRDE